MRKTVHRLARLVQFVAVVAALMVPMAVMAADASIQPQSGTLIARGTEVDVTVSLSAPAAAPVGLGSTGEPASTVHTSYLGVPAISLPLFRDQGLPLGLQVVGFENDDPETFAAAAWMESALG